MHFFCIRRPLERSMRNIIRIAHIAHTNLILLINLIGLGTEKELSLIKSSGGRNL